MDPREYPPDELIAKWSYDYGTTGVKIYELESPHNEGCVAVYRECSLEERSMLARLATIDEQSPGAFDYMRMFVSLCLLYPTLDAYPHTAFAAAELFTRIRQHGHGSLDDDEEDIGNLPEHIVHDIQNSRITAQSSFNDPAYTSLYRHLILDMVTVTGNIDVQLLDHLWRLSPGRIRDIAARVEQAHIVLRSSAFNQIEQMKDVKQQRAAAERVEQLYPSPFAAVDDASHGATIPAQEQEELEKEETPVVSHTNEDLPPNAPPNKAELIKLIESAGLGI